MDKSLGVGGHHSAHYIPPPQSMTGSSHFSEQCFLNLDVHLSYLGLCDTANPDSIGPGGV